MRTHVATVEFQATVRRPLRPEGAPWTFVRLPMDASAQLPSRSQVSVAGWIGAVAFQATLQPDGEGGHWLKLDHALMLAAEVAAGVEVQFRLRPCSVEPEPELPADLDAALAAHPAARTTWNATTALARRDWIHWIGSGKQAATRVKRIQSACSMLAAGKRRVCCFDRSGQYSRTQAAPEAAP